MHNSYTPLGQIENLDTKGWSIDFNQVMTPKRGVDPYIFLMDKFYESYNEEFACLFYTIVERRMNYHAGLIAVFENKRKPELITNPIKEWFTYWGDDTLYFDNDFLFIRKEAYNPDKLLSGTPFVAIDLKNKNFGFIDFDASSIYYSPVQVDKTIYKFHLDSSNDLVSSRFVNRNNETFDLSAITFHSLDTLNNANKIYKNEKAEKNKRLST